jgi:hypothetical protein
MPRREAPGIAKSVLEGLEELKVLEPKSYHPTSTLQRAAIFAITVSIVSGAARAIRTLSLFESESGLFLLMLVLAAVNRVWRTPALAWISTARDRANTWLG